MNIPEPEEPFSNISKRFTFSWAEELLYGSRCRIEDQTARKMCISSTQFYTSQGAANPQITSRSTRHPKGFFAVSKWVFLGMSGFKKPGCLFPDRVHKAPEHHPLTKPKDSTSRPLNKSKSRMNNIFCNFPRETQVKHVHQIHRSDSERHCH